MSLDIVNLSPAPDAEGVEPDTYVSFSIRDTSNFVTTFSVTLVGVLAADQAGIKAGFEGSIVPNGFFGFDVKVRPIAEFELDDSLPQTVAVAAQDAVAVTDNENWSFFVRVPDYDTVRFAVPKPTQDADPILMKWLKIWDGVFHRAASDSVGKMLKGGLFDVNTLAVEALPMAFADAGLVYPEFSEVSVERKRRILKNADAIHQSRYSLEGLKFYISLLVDADVEVTKLNRGFFFFFNSAPFGFPTPEMMISSETGDDICIYLIGERDNEIVVTITGTVSDAMKAFLEETILRELPMSGEPRELTIIYV